MHLDLSRRTQPRTGMTLIEVLVVFGILSFLLALILPAIAWSRESARRMHCVSRLRDIGVALQRFEQDHQRYPGSAPAIRLLPYLGQQPLYERLTAGTGEPVRDFVPEWYFCPSDPAAPGIATNYVWNIGFPYYGYNGFFRNPWYSVDRGRPLRSADIHDGLSNTVAFSEILRHDGQHERLRAVWFYPESIEFSASQLEELADFVETLPRDPERHGYYPQPRTGSWHYSTAHIYHHMLPPNRPSAARNGSSPGQNCYSAVSLHPGGANALYGDGHVEFISQAIDRQVWRDTGSRSTWIPVE